MASQDWLFIWVWGLGQATLIGGLVWLFLFFAARLPPAVRVRISLCGLVVMTVLPWTLWLPLESFFDSITRPSRSPNRAHSTDIADRMESDQGPTSNTTDAWGGIQEQATQWLLVAISQQATHVPVPNAASTVEANVGWKRGMIYLLLGMVGWGWLRLGVGMLQLHRLTGRAKDCRDQRLLQLVSGGAFDERVTRGLVWRVSEEISTPAVVGWWRPMIILPSDWNGWNESELKSAIAHELAHVSRFDGLTNAIAQAAVAMNYFHPLAHLLARSLRMDQELAADCMAAAQVGGKQCYLENLAGLALRRADAFVGGPALAFLPTRHTFVRRLEMLRDLNIASNQRRGVRLIGWLLPGCLILVSFSATMIRPVRGQQTVTPALSPAGQSPSDVALEQKRAQVPPGNAGAAGQQPASLLRCIPDAWTGGVVWFDVAKGMQNSNLATMLQQIPADQQVIRLPFINIILADLEEAMVLVGNSFGSRELVVLLRYRDAAKIPQATPGDQVGRPHVFPFDARTIMLCEEEQPVKTLLTMAGTVKTETGLASLADRHTGALIKAGVRVSTLAKRANLPAESMVVAPLYRDVSTLTVGLQLESELKIETFLDTDKPQSVHDTLQAMRTFAKNGLNDLTYQANEGTMGKAEMMAFVGMMQAVAGKALDDVKINQEAKRVTLTLQIDQAVPAIMGMAIPAMDAARKSSARQRAMNNLKQIVLALHNYHEAYGHFPPAIVLENGVARSWRVELLPFLEQAHLYDQYRKNEPWDSPANQAVMQAMPMVYQPTVMTTRAPAVAFSTGFRGIGGKQGVLGSASRFSDITDGTSNTLCVVEVTNYVPWTQPDEYDVTPQQLLDNATLPDGLFVARTDGSVQVLSKQLDPQILQALMTKDGGEVIPNL